VDANTRAARQSGSSSGGGSRGASGPIQGISSPPAAAAAEVAVVAQGATAAAAGSPFMSPAVSLSGGLAPVRTHPAAAVSTPSPVASLGAWGQQRQQQGTGTSPPAAYTPGKPAGSSSSLQGSNPTAAATTAASAVAGELISLDSSNLDSQQVQGQAGDGALLESQLLQLPVSSSSNAGFAAGGTPPSQYNPFAVASAAATAAGAGGSPAR
jgi:hypothetical protein